VHSSAKDAAYASLNVSGYLQCRVCPHVRMGEGGRERGGVWGWGEVSEASVIL